jgi:hypothetical protein
VQVAQLVQAKHLIGGSVARLGERLVLNLVLIDAAAGTALQRTNREAGSAPELLEQARSAGIALLQPILSERRGYLNIAANVPDATVIVDDQRRLEGVGQVIALAAGPHAIQVSRDGFYTASADVLVKPGRVETESVSLIPAKETIESYESKAHLMRYGAYAGGALAIGAGVVAAIFYGKATDAKTTVDSFTNGLDADRARVGFRQQALTAHDDFQVDQSVYLIALGGAVLAGATGLYLLLAGDDPDRYREFHAISGK